MSESGSPSVLVLQHVACETLGNIEHALGSQGLSHRDVRIFDGEEVPKSCDDAFGLIVMGGPMSVNDADRLPHLKAEMQLIEEALSKKLPILGICLGSQLLARALGATIVPGQRLEIGWHDVQLTGSGLKDPLWTGSPRTFQGFHWHGEVFNLPDGCERLASSDLTETQAFRYGNSAYGVLFHMEVNRPLMEAMAESFTDELHQSGGNLAELRTGADKHLESLQTIGNRFFERWAGLVSERAN